MDHHRYVLIMYKNMCETGLQQLIFKRRLHLPEALNGMLQTTTVRKVILSRNARFNMIWNTVKNIFITQNLIPEEMAFQEVCSWSPKSPLSV